MTTQFANITGAVIAALSAAPAVSANVFRARDRVLAEQHADALNVQIDGAEGERGAMKGAPVDWLTKVTIEGFARATVGQSPDIAVDPLLGGVYARIAADSTLGNVVADIWCAAFEFEYNEERQKTGWFRMTYLAQHRTSNLTLD